MHSQEMSGVLSAIRLGEDSKVEFKEVVVSAKGVRSPLAEDFADELAAMGNTLEGTVLLGVRDEDREVIGIPLEDLDQVEISISTASADPNGR